MKKATIILLLCVFLIGLPIGILHATEINQSDDYKPLDVIVILDRSGSMNESDPTRMTAAAIKMLINMMPAEDSKVGIVNFSSDAEIITKDEKGQEALIDLNDISGIERNKTVVDNINNEGWTGIGNALIKAKQLLESKGRKDSQKAMILFTDGVDTLETDKALAQCKENESDAIIWAKQNNCPIYCIGLNYIDENGKDSMGENGEGIKKLKTISTETNGLAEATSNLKEVENLFIQMLADVCSLYYQEAGVVPGDGGRHEIPIQVGPSVVEVNIRMTSESDNAIKDGSIELYDPSGNKITLTNTENIRYDVDTSSANIKVILPETGSWKLIVNGIKGDTIKIGFLEHYDLGIDSTLTLPEVNPEGTVYVGDPVSVKTVLTSGDQPITDKELYNTVKEAKMTIIPRNKPDQIKVVSLSLDNDAFKGGFTIEENSVFDVHIQIIADSFYREDLLVLQSDNHPLTINKTIPNVSLFSDDQTVVENLYSYVSDIEGDGITAKIVKLSDPETAELSIDEKGNLIIQGKKWSSTTATVAFTDEQGNTVETTFKIKVKSFVATIMSIVLLILLLAGLITLIILFILLNRRIKGVFVLNEVNLFKDGQQIHVEKEYHFDEIDENYIFNAPTIFRRSRDYHLAALLAAINDRFEFGNQDAKAFFKWSETEAGLDALARLKEVKLKGSFRGRNGFVVKMPKEDMGIQVNQTRKDKLKIVSGRNMNINLFTDDKKELLLTIDLDYQKKR